MWHRVFGLNDIMPQPAQMQEEFGWGEITVRGDDLGWTAIEAALYASSVISPRPTTFATISTPGPPGWKPATKPN